jgi:DNA polymerase-3 subunit delta'
MGFSAVIAQDRVKRMLSGAIREQAISHAYCFYGEEGIGKDALAIAYAQILNCSHPNILADGIIDACGQCKSCLDSTRLEHPNIMFISALPAGKTSSKNEDSPLLQLSDDMLALYKQEMILKAEDPYHVWSLPNAQTIRIASIRDIKKQVKMSATQSGRRVFIISQADKMNIEAANAFLKTLEEPHDNITFILTTSKKDALPQTILSRCQQVYCDLLPSEDLIDALCEKQGISRSESQLIEAFAQGSYGRACSFLNEDIQSMRSDIIDLLRSALKRKHYRLELMQQLDRILTDKDRSSQELLLRMLALWIRDCHYASIVTDSNDGIMNIDQIDSIRKFASAFPDADYHAILHQLEQSMEHIRRNVNGNLVMLSTMLACREAFLLNTREFIDHAPKDISR